MKLLSILSFLLLNFSVFSQDRISVHYKIYDTRTRQRITIDKIRANLADADVLFFGEEHADSAGHYLEK